MSDSGCLRFPQQKLISLCGVLQRGPIPAVRPPPRRRDRKQGARCQNYPTGPGRREILPQIRRAYGSEMRNKALVHFNARGHAVYAAGKQFNRSYTVVCFPFCTSHFTFWFPLLPLETVYFNSG